MSLERVYSVHVSVPLQIQQLIHPSQLLQVTLQCYVDLLCFLTAIQMPIQMPTCISCTLTVTILVTAAQVCLMSLLTKMEFTPVFLSTKSAGDTMLLLASLLLVSHEMKPVHFKLKLSNSCMQNFLCLKAISYYFILLLFLMNWLSGKANA